MTSRASPLPVARLLWCAAAIVTLSMGVRHGFGLWLGPITLERAWTRETFSLALAVQNLVWGLAGPFTGLAADRLGAHKVLAVGALLYAAGLAVMALAPGPALFIWGSGALLGVALACTTYAVAYGVIGRQLPPERRSWAMGVTAAAGSFGQFALLPLEAALIGAAGWQVALFWLALATLVIAPLGLGLRERGHAAPARSLAGSAKPGDGEAASSLHALREALGSASFNWLTAGYFVCGFQVVFIGVHLPAYLKDYGLAPNVAANALALIGLFNIVGTYSAGLLGERLPRRHVLSLIYALRAVAITAFIAVPPTPATVYLFSAVIGTLWLSTVPLTNGVVAHVFGVRYLSMLSGVVFLSHQVGSFLGVWLGGLLYDRTGSYDVVWYLAIALGVAAALANQPVREVPLARRVAA